jgi:hypothetical protein
VDSAANASKKSPIHCHSGATLLIFDNYTTIHTLFIWEINVIIIFIRYGTRERNEQTETTIA